MPDMIIKEPERLKLFIRMRLIGLKTNVPLNLILIRLKYTVTAEGHAHAHVPRIPLVAHAHDPRFRHFAPQIMRMRMTPENPPFCACAST